MTFTLPTLPYSHDALEPHIDAVTMEIHHGKHHAGYTKKLNAAIAGTELEGKDILYVLKNTELAGENTQKVIDNGGGFYNHSLFWETMCPANESTLSEDSVIGKVLVERFGSVEDFKKEFADFATGQFGSGWGRLVKDNETGDIFLSRTANQYNPVMDENITILMGVDVREHAYYLKYQNKRAEYVNNRLNIVNREVVESRYSGE